MNTQVVEAIAMASDRISAECLRVLADGLVAKGGMNDVVDQFAKVNTLHSRFNRYHISMMVDAQTELEVKLALRTIELETYAIIATVRNEKWIPEFDLSSGYLIV